MKTIQGFVRRTQPFVCSASTRLALSYLVIFMVLSVSFSIVLYKVSSDSLQETKTPATSTNSARSIVENNRGVLVPNNSPDTKYRLPTNGKPQLGGEASAGALKRQVGQQIIASIQKRLVERLVFLNVSVLILGAGLSYGLARRTLRPIEAAMEAQARFTSDASHELRTPLTVIQAETEGALRMLKLPERARTVLQSNLEEIVQLKQLSESLLKLARNAEVIPVGPVPVDEVVAKARRRAAKFAQTRAITIQATIPHIDVLADTISLTQIISILLDNAIRYSPRKGIITIEAHADSKKHTHIIVRDHGIGIDRTELSRIFDRFYRSEQARKQSATGHGLGLSIAQKLAERQHGRLTAESEVGKGSVFTVTLPTFKNS